MAKKRDHLKSVNSRPRDSAWDASALRAVVEARGMRAEHLSVATGATAETCRRWLEGRTAPDFPTGKVIAEFLHVPLVDLLPNSPGAGGFGTSSSARGAKH